MVSLLCMICLYDKQKIKNRRESKGKRLIGSWDTMEGHLLITWVIEGGRLTEVWKLTSSLRPLKMVIPQQVMKDDQVTVGPTC